MKDLRELQFRTAKLPRNAPYLFSWPYLIFPEGCADEHIKRVITDINRRMKHEQCAVVAADGGYCH